MIIISCGAKKIETPFPVQAWKLYQGIYFKTMLNLAITKSENVFILSAGYGLLKLNDVILSYDIKMDKRRSVLFRKNKICNFSGLSLLGENYKQAVNGNLIDLIPKSIGGMGRKMSYAKKITDKNCLIDLNSLQDGEFKQLINLEKV